MGRRGVSDGVAPTSAEQDAEGVETSAEVTRTIGAPRSARWEWARHWDLWLALAVGAFLRFWHLDLTSFLVDQNISMRLARTAVLGHLLPVTSVEYSVGGYAPPFGLDLVLPFAFFSHDPMPVVISIAVWNVLGLALCYFFALKYFGRWVAGVGTLLLATCAVAVNYSRFIWQPNYETTFLVLWAIALYAWCISGRRAGFAVSGILLILLVEITPVAILLVPITVVAWLLAEHRPRGRDYAILGGAVLIILSPTLLWEAITHGLDFQLLLLHPSGGTSTIDLAVVRVFFATIGDQGLAGLGIALLVAAGYAILSRRVFAPMVRIWREQETSPGAKRLTARVARWWVTLRADRRWCAELLLWLWVTLPPLSMIRHSSRPTVPYLLLIYPAIFLVAALPLRWLRETDVLARLTGRTTTGRIGPRAVALGGVVVASLVVVAQTAQSAQATAALLGPSFNALQFYGYPLAEVQTAEQSITAVKQNQGAGAIYFSLPAQDRYRLGMDYVLVGEHTDRIGFEDDCLVLPPAAASPSLVVSTTAGSPAGQLLPLLSNAQPVADIPVAGGAPFHVYRMSGPVPPLPGESPLSPAVYRATSRDTLQLDAAEIGASGTLRLRWTVLAAAPLGTAPAVYHIQARSADQQLTAGLGAVDCQPTYWQAGQTVFTWLSLTPAGRSGASHPPTAIAITLSASAPALYTPQVGPLHLMSGRYINDTPIVIRPTGTAAGAGASATSGIAPDGSYFLTTLPLVGA
jgi:hypothetical protein